MKAYSGKELCKLLEEHGWYLVRAKGSHRHYNKLGTQVLITVPVHSNKPLKKGTQMAILQSADLLDKI